MLGKRSRTCEFGEINELLYKWYSIATARNIYPSGPQLCEKARLIAEQLSFHNFKASNGWLNCWKKRCDVHRMTVCGESGDVSGETVDSWKERLPELVHGYSAENIWNLDETRCFWRALPEYGFGRRGLSVKEEKRQNNALLFAL